MTLSSTITAKPPTGAAASTYHALLWELREYGVEHLKKARTQARFAELSSEQIGQLIAALIRLQPRYADRITDGLIAILRNQV